MALADIFARARRDLIDPNISAPLPYGVRFRLRDQIQISPSETFACRVKRVFGYIATIKLADSAGTDTPASCRAILKLHWRYGLSPSGTKDSFLHLRIDAYTSSLCMDINTRVFRIGDIASVFIAKSSSGFEPPAHWRRPCLPSRVASFCADHLPREVHPSRIGSFSLTSTRGWRHADLAFFVRSP